MLEKRNYGLSHVVKRVLDEHRNHQRKRTNHNDAEYLAREKKDGHKLRKRSNQIENEEKPGGVEEIE